MKLTLAKSFRDHLTNTRRSLANSNNDLKQELAKHCQELCRADDFEPKKTGNYIAIRDNQITYLPNNRTLKKGANGGWLMDNRVLTKPGRWFKKAFPQASPELCEAFTKSLNEFDTDAVELIDGEAIREAYHEDNYHSHSGPLGNSCMRHEYCQKFLDVYVEEPAIRLAVIKVGNKIAARAVFWKLDSGKQLLDRIYYSHEKYLETLIQWAKENDIKSYDNEGIWDRGYVAEVTCRKTYPFYPYMDSLYKLEGKVLRSKGPGRDLQSEDGNGARLCCVTNEFITLGMEEYVESQEDYAHRDQTFVCEGCNYTELKRDSMEHQGHLYCSYCKDDRFHFYDKYGYVLHTDTVWCEFDDQDWPKVACEEFEGVGWVCEQSFPEFFEEHPQFDPERAKCDVSGEYYKIVDMVQIGDQLIAVENQEALEAV